MRMVRMLQRQWPGSPGVRDFLWHKERRLLALQVPSYHVRDRGLPVIFPALLTVCSGQQGTGSHQKSHLAKPNNGAPDKRPVRFLLSSASSDKGEHD